MAVGGRREKAQIGRKRRPFWIDVLPNSGLEQRQAEIKYIGKNGCILPCNAVAVRRLGHGLQQADRCGLEHVVAHTVPEPGRRGPHDGTKRELGILRVKRLEDVNQQLAQVGGFRISCCGEGRAEQDDPQIGIGADGGKGRLDRAQDACADACSLRRQRSGCCLGAGDELVRRHAMAGGKNMNIAGLRRVELGKARPLERICDPLRAQSYAIASRGARPARAAVRASTKTDAMLMDVTFCSPDQAGMLLTSSTVGRWSAAYTISTPAKSAPTAAAACTASAFISSLTTAATGRPPRFTLVIQ